MTENLIQEEPDSMPTDAGEDSIKTAIDRSIRNYDFRHQDRLKRNTRKILQNTHESFAKELAADLNDRLRANVSIHLVSVDQLSLKELTENMLNPTCLYGLKLVPFDRQAVLEIHPHLAYYIVDRILGGPGHGSKLSRELTRIEQRIMNHLLEDIGGFLRSAWQHAASFEIATIDYFTSANYLRFAGSGESIISITLKVNIEKSENLVMINYPYYLVENLLPALAHKDDSAEAKPVLEHRKIIQRNIESTATSVSVYLGQSRLTLEEIINLQTGDVILLNRQTADNLELLIGDRSRFYGRAGVLKKRLAFKITDRNEE